MVAADPNDGPCRGGWPHRPLAVDVETLPCPGDTGAVAPRSYSIAHVRRVESFHGHGSVRGCMAAFHRFRVSQEHLRFRSRIAASDERSRHGRDERSAASVAIGIAGGSIDAARTDPPSIKRNPYLELFS